MLPHPLSMKETRVRISLWYAPLLPTTQTLHNARRGAQAGAEEHRYECQGPQGEIKVLQVVPAGSIGWKGAGGKGSSGHIGCKNAPRPLPMLCVRVLASFLEQMDC